MYEFKADELIWMLNIDDHSGDGKVVAYVSGQGLEWLFIHFKDADSLVPEKVDTSIYDTLDSERSDILFSGHFGQLERVFNMISQFMEEFQAEQLQDIIDRVHQNL